MAGCAVCLHKNVHPNVCSDCLGGTHFKPRKKTNAGRIRSLSDEELAEWLAILTDCADYCPCRDPYDQCDTVDGSCKKQWLDWLKEEAEGDT